MTTIKALLGGATAMLLAAASLTFAAAPSRADDSVMHHVKYTGLGGQPDLHRYLLP